MKPCSRAAACLLSIVMSAAALAQSSVGAGPPPDPPVPHDQQLREAIQKLTTTGRMMMVVAHPDDEDGPLLTYEARAKGNQVMLFTFTRGEGGQDATGAIFGDELGLLRTMELLASDKDYGVEQRFSRVADFGFSKTPEETFAKWGGRDVPLGDLVRQIRLFRPDVLIARFSGTPRDGHGHHQASSLLTQEAFRAAADPKRFPEQNLPPWQCKKLYIENVPDDQVTLRIDTGAVDPVMGESPAKVALEGLRHQASQGLADIQFNPARAQSRLKLVAVADGVTRVEHEKDIFDGLDTSLKAIHARDRARLEESIREIAAAVGAPNKSSTALGQALVSLRRVGEESTICAGFGCEPSDVLVADKLRQTQEALRIALGLEIHADTSAQPLNSATDRLSVRVNVDNDGDKSIQVRGCVLAQDVSIHMEQCQRVPDIQPNWHGVMNASIVLASGEVVSAPFYRKNSLVDPVYQLQSSSSLDQPLPPPTLTVRLNLTANGTEFQTEVPVMQHEFHSGIFLAPALTLESSPSSFLRTTRDTSESQLSVTAQNHSQSAGTAQATWSAPSGWVVTPKSTVLNLAAQGNDRSQTLIMPTAVRSDAQETVGARATEHERAYLRGVHLLYRPDLDAFPYYFPAETTFYFIRAEVSPDLTVGYIMGAGDNIPDALTSLGVHVTLLTPEDLAHGDLSKYSTIVTGIRAYATRKDLRDNNARLLDYVRNGGTMVVQYEQDWRGFNAGHYTPYPMELGNIRADQEELPVTLLHPDDVLFHAPNTVTEADFHGWIQEYGLYFADKWDPAYEPLLGMHDAGEPAHDGSLLRAHYGKGVWMYSGLAMFRQVPNGVPGATRLFLNLLSAGHTASDAPVISARASASRQP